MTEFLVTRALRVTERKKVDAVDQDTAQDKAFESDEGWELIYDDVVDVEVETL